MNSYYRRLGTNANPEFILKEPIILKDPNHFFKATVMSVDIPYSFKTINSGNNKLNVDISYHSNPIQSFILTFTEGNYNILTLLNEFKLQLIDKCTIVEPNHVPDFNFTYDRDTGKVTFLIIHISGQEWAIFFNWSLGTSDLLAPFFGYDPSLGIIQTTLYADNANPNGLYVDNISPYTVNVSPVTSLYLRSSSLAQESNNVEFLVSADDSVSDILLKIPINSFPTSWILYENALSFSVRLTLKSIDKIDFYLTDGQTYEPLILNNVHWKIHLLIEEVQPDWVVDLKNLEAEKAQKLQELESLKQSLVDDLYTTSSEIKNNIQTIPEKEQIDIKQDFLNEIEKNRRLLSTDFFNPSNI